jgi:hypothetical protein
MSNNRSASASIPATTEDNASESRPRLNHTVTLGEIDVAPVQAEAGQGAFAGPSLIVNNYNQVNVVSPGYGYGYGNYGYSRNPAGFLPGRVTPLAPSPAGPRPELSLRDLASVTVDSHPVGRSRSCAPPSAWVMLGTRLARCRALESSFMLVARDE